MATRTRQKVKVERQTSQSKKWVHARITRPGEEDEELEDTEEIEVLVFETEPAYVRVNAGVTKKIVEYESLRVDIGASIPCYREQMQEQMDVTAEWVADRLDLEVDKYLGLDDEGEEEDEPSSPRKKIRASKKKSKKKSKSKTNKVRARRSRRDT